ncbi:Thioredoxin domain protein [Methylocella silvestris BL2]|uniref:Thioredoxin domain protein n=1 Tax=Methylocella silvestris (strain DSM 15510 / CIP 108128 / LMG 27833 / NCIMB 13906 / BL2) TaxID=395965 RepID=B8EJW8_METSB|nr:thioredoxin family protein [Methylocella silvestris]ACK49915.1 Thioredoxin domain protein [Methylocella silvestris BL2]
MYRRTVLAALTGALALFSVAAGHAAESAEFTQGAFEAAQKAGRPILIEITAPWCPTCRAQKPILSELTAAPKFEDLAVFDVDFDSRKDVLRLFHAQSQSTLIAFRGPDEVGRSVGDTAPASIAALLNKTLSSATP